MRRTKILLVPILVIALAGCGVAQWVKLAQQILPVVLPMVTNLVTAVSLLEGKTISSPDLSIITQTANQVSNDLNLVGQLINQYDSSPNVTTVQKIQTALQDVHSNLNGLLPALHINDPATVQKISAVVTLIGTEVDSLAQLLPVISSGKLQVRKGPLTLPLGPKQLKQEFNAVVTQPTANANVNQVFAKAVLK
ncbi:MAG TPA: hypothetical protein VKV79_03245 [Terriglobia bacterium]|nr:hypothetical protein [Terriglobia bacterium]